MTVVDVSPSTTAPAEEPALPPAREPAAPSTSDGGGAQPSAAAVAARHPPPPPITYPTTAADPPLSKNQQKKIRRYEAKRARLSALKAAAKASRAEATAARRAAACARIEAMSADEKAEWRAAKAAKQAVRRAAATAKTARLDAAYAPGAPVPHVIIDLCEDYTALMTPRERTSLASQLRACYAANAASPHPLRLTFAGWGRAWADAMGGASSGLHAWKIGLEEGDFTAAARAAGGPGAKAVYLSADADAEVAALEPGVSYIIGGLVDRNRHKGVAAQRAAGFAGVGAARLPIGAHAALAASAVLTVDQVARLLVTWWTTCQSRREGGGEGEGGVDASACWAVAVREAVPARKMVGGGGSGGGSSAPAEEAEGGGA